MRHTGSSIFFVSAFLLASTASAQGTRAERREARTIAGQANEHYNLGHFAEALEAYERAYSVYAAPQILFNLGQCQRELGNHERAVFFFERYLEELPRAVNRQVVEQLLVSSRSSLEDAARQAEEEARQRERREELRLQREAEASARLAEAEERRRTEARDALLAAASETVAVGTEVYEEWWFWTLIGLALAGGAGVTIGVVLLDPGSLPQGTLGVLDAR